MSRTEGARRQLMRMNRRDFIRGSTSVALLAGGTSGGLRAASAQQQHFPTIGWLNGVWGHLIGMAASGASKHGVEFKVQFSRWCGGGRADQLDKCAAELVKRPVDVILAFSTQSALAAKTATSIIPIIFLADDPVAAGLVDSLDRPGGNLTGATCLVSGLTTTRIQIIRELVPATTLVVLVTDPSNKGAYDMETREAQAAAKALGVELSIIAWTGEHAVEPELEALPRDRKAVLVFGWGLPFRWGHAPLSYLAQTYGFPAISGDRQETEYGGMVSFGPRFEDGAYLMGDCAARVLKGEKPADVPIQKFTKTELVINLWGAKALGIQIPAALLARADEVIK